MRPGTQVWLHRQPWLELMSLALLPEGDRASSSTRAHDTGCERSCARADNRCLYLPFTPIRCGLYRMRATAFVLQTRLATATLPRAQRRWPGNRPFAKPSYSNEARAIRPGAPRGWHALAPMFRHTRSQIGCSHTNEPERATKGGYQNKTCEASNCSKTCVAHSQQRPHALR